MEQHGPKKDSQFAHIDTFARKPKPGTAGAKWSALDVLSEAMRKPGHCEHVAAPQPPKVIAGIHPEELLACLDKLLESRLVAGRRRPRGDVHVLACAVYSWPEHVDYADQERLQAWIDDTLAWHAQQVGPIDSAVLHMDEAFPHLHVYTVSADARGLTPGWQAKRAAAEAGASAQQQGQAYREAMRGWQDRYYAGVGAYHGLERLGPARQRLSRSEWRAAKAERLRAADARRAARDAALAAERAAAQAQQEAHDAHERATQAQIRQQMASARAAQLAAESQQLEHVLARARGLETDLHELPALRTRTAQDARRLQLIDLGLELSALADDAHRGELIRACQAMTSGGPEQDSHLLQLIERVTTHLQPPEPESIGPEFD